MLWDVAIWRSIPVGATKIGPMCVVALFNPIARCFASDTRMCGRGKKAR